MMTMQTMPVNVSSGPMESAQRPWWMNYSNEELLALPPAMLASLPPEAMATFPNDIFVAHPELLQKLHPDQVKARGFGMDFQSQQNIGAYAPQASGAPTYPSVVKTGIVPPRVQAGLTPLKPGTGYGGQPVSPFAVNYEGAGIRHQSTQSWNAMNPSDQEATLATYKGVGIQQPQDVVADINRNAQSRFQPFTPGRRPPVY